MAKPTRIRTIDFLPEIFQTSTNQQFLASTLDQLVAQPEFARRQGYIGSRVGLGVVSKPRTYVPEPDKTRTDYQLEPAVAFLRPETDSVRDMITYPGLLSAIENSSGLTDNHQRLWQNQYYSWDPMVNLDTLVNYTQYYWLPYGPDAVIVSAGTVYTRGNYTVTDDVTAFTISGFSVINPRLILARGGTYTFRVDQSQPFWIQGSTGTDSIVNNQDTRQVLGVVNNGIEQGTVVFSVPELTAQDRFYDLADSDLTADLVTTQPYSTFVDTVVARFTVSITGDIATVTNYDAASAVIINGAVLAGINNNTGEAILAGTQIVYDDTLAGAGSGGAGVYRVTVSQTVTVIPAATATALAGKTVRDIGGNIDGVTDLDNKTILFYDDLDAAHNGRLYQINLLPTPDINYDIDEYSRTLYDQSRTFSFTELAALPLDTKILITSGREYAGVNFFRDSQRGTLLTPVPYLTARSNTLYYQNGGVNSAFGEIQIIDRDANAVIDVEADILGKLAYQSPNGVVFTNGLKVLFDGNVRPSSYEGQEYYVSGVGTAIELIPVQDLTAYEPYTQTVYLPWDNPAAWDQAPWDQRLYVPLQPDYITINRASANRNPWSRSNRWFHIDVLEKTATYNNTVSGAAGIDLQQARAQRPIIEFVPDLALWDSGSTAALPVDFIDVTVTNATEQVSGSAFVQVTAVSSGDNSLTLASSINARFTPGTPVRFTGTALGQRYQRIVTATAAAGTGTATITFSAATSITDLSAVTPRFLSSPPRRFADITNISRAAVAQITLANTLPEPIITGDTISISNVQAMGRLAGAPAGYLPTINNAEYFETTPYYVQYVSTNLDGSRVYNLYFDAAFTRPVDTTYYGFYLANTGGFAAAAARGTWGQLNDQQLYIKFLDDTTAELYYDAATSIPVDAAEFGEYTDNSGILGYGAAGLVIGQQYFIDRILTSRQITLVDQDNNPLIIPESQQITDFAGAADTVSDTIVYSPDPNTQVPTDEGWAVFPGARVIFAADQDPEVRNKIWQVKFLNSNVQRPTIILEALEQVSADSLTIVKNGYSRAGQSWRFTGGEWQPAQSKTTVNQPPLFDVFDQNGTSFGDADLYTNTSFTGTRLFSYAAGTGNLDPVLGIALRYQTVGTIGDIVFDVNLNTDTFTYNQGSAVETLPLDSGYIHRTQAQQTQRLTGWVTAAAPSFQPQIFEFFYDPVNAERRFICDVAAQDMQEYQWQTVQVFVNNKYLTQYPVGSEQIPANANYTVTVTDTQTLVTVNVPMELGTAVQIFIVSEQVSATAYYKVPSNLENNPLNDNPEYLSLGDIRGHYTSIIQNYAGAAAIAGYVFGDNNYRDLGDVRAYGNKIIQSSASMMLPAAFLRENDTNIFDAISFNAQEYDKFRALLISVVDQGAYPEYSTPAQILDHSLDTIAAAKKTSTAFFWTDMIVNGSPFTENTYPINVNRNSVIYSLSRIYDYSSANYQGLAVYLTTLSSSGDTVTQQLIRGQDYTVSDISPSLTVTRELLAGEQITIREYNQTYGSYVPATPTKLGLYPSFLPRILVDNTYLVPTTVLIGHDGSYTRLYGEYVNGELTDVRDQVLYEFELRVYNNLKISSPVPLLRESVWPGEFRSTDYVWPEIESMYSPPVLNYFGQNRLNYASQLFIDANQFTYNYADAQDKLTGQPLQQAFWRGIYLWLYDTDTPNLTPWQMLGLTQEPSWWQQRYGTAPYTSDNLVLWQDLAAGRIWNGSDAATIIDLRFARPQLLECLPVNNCGDLVSPLISIVRDYDSNKFQANWQVGDMAPAEAAYFASSTWPFDLQRLLALTKPAQWFNLMADRDRYKYDQEFDQYLYDQRQHLTPSALEIYGEGTAKHSYINWLVDYQLQFGENGTENIQQLLSNLDVRLAYRMAGFSSSVLADFIIDQTTTATPGSLRIPDTDYDLLLYKNQPTDTITYSSVIVQKTDEGWQVYGNSQSTAYFSTVTALENGQYIRLNDRVRVTKNYLNTEMRIPYGQLFTSLDQVCQFMVDYGRFLELRGVKFASQDQQELEQGWFAAAREFLIWAQTGWSTGSTANFNPAYRELMVDTQDSVVQPLTVGRQNFILNQNLVPVSREAMCINREGTEFVAKVLNESDTIAYSQLNLSSYEHAVVFKNSTSFGDILYNPITALRQPRLFLEARVSTEWQGAVDAQGFLFNLEDVPQWNPRQYYTQGTLVAYKNQYWAASANIQPSAVFQTDQWVLSDFDKIAKGILANPSTRAVDSAVFYDTNIPALTADADELSYSLIGFRAREYLALANFDLISQVNIYKNMIKEKGTNAIAEAFKGTNFTQGSVDYDIHENWSIMLGEYGGVLSENYIEAVLNPSLLKGNPNIIKFVNSAADTDTSVNQTIPVSNLWDYGHPVTAPNVLPVLTDAGRDRVLTAGYVSFSDVKYAAYNKLDFNLNPEILDNLYRNDYVWVARDDASWQVYTTASIGTAITTARNNFDGTSTIIFADKHSLAAGDFISVSNFSPEFNGFYIVQQALSLTEITVNTPELAPSVREVQALGVGLKLTSQRVASASDIQYLDLVSSEFSDTLTWVDDYAGTGWAVVAKDINYTAAQTLTLADSVAFGTTMAWTADIGYLIADPVTNQVVRLSADLAVVDQFTPGSGVTTKILASGDTAVFLQPDVAQAVVYPFRDGATVTTISGTSGFATNGAVSGDGQYLFVYNNLQQTITVYIKDASGDYQARQQIELPSQVGISNLNWAADITTNYDGSLLFVTDPGAGIDNFRQSGAVYVFQRGAVSAVINDFVMIQLIVTDQVQNSSEFGLGMSNNLWASELVIGAPGFITDIFKSQGVAYRYTNTGKRFGQTISDRFLPSETITGTLVVNGTSITAQALTPQQAVTAILASNIDNITASLVALDDGSTQIIIETVNKSTEPVDNILDVTGTQASLTAWKIKAYTLTQTILEPQQQLNSRFGTTVAFDEHDTVVITAPQANARALTAFVETPGDLKTIFDQDTTTFVDTFAAKGAAYMFDYLPGVAASVSDSGAYVYAQSVNNINNSGNYGTNAVLFADYKLLISEPNSVQVFVNATQRSDWHIDKQSLAIVDINSLDGVNIFDRDTNDTQGYLDYIDPLRGRFLAAAQQNLDYISTQDPAGYNSAARTSTGLVVWGSEQVGKIWFDLSQVRYVDTHQPDLSYNANFWGSAFPGSTASVWTWTKQSVTPDLYAGAGEIKNITDFVVAQELNNMGEPVPVYYYWVKNDGIVYRAAGKTLDSQSIANYLTNPIGSGISYLAAITNNAVAIYNSNQLLNTNTPTLHIEWDTGSSADQQHEQVQLIRDGVAEDFLLGFPTAKNTQPTALYQKYINSISGIQATGFVLDTVTVTNGGTGYTSAPEVLIVPVQADLMAPGSNDPQAARAVAQISGGRVINVVFTSVGSGYTIVPNVEFVGGGGTGATAVINSSTAYRTVPDLTLTPPKRYGVSFSPNQTMFLDRQSATQNYAEFANRIFSLFPIAEIKNPTFLTVQGVSYVNTVRTEFDTADYWQYANWWQLGYSNVTKVVAEVAGLYALPALNLRDGEVARVKYSSGARSEYYAYIDGSYTRVGLENGTIELLPTLWLTDDDAAKLADYWITRAINEQIFTEELLEYRNQGLILMFKYAQTEAMDSQNFLPWLNKTSFVDVASNVRELLPYTSYKADISAFLTGYLTEVKPFHVNIKSFSYRYNGQDNFYGNFTDFDVPAQYQRSINTYVSPRLVYNPDQVNEYNFLPSADIWQTLEYSNWYSAYGLSVAQDGTEYVSLAVLALYIDRVNNQLTLDNAYGFPEQGVILIDSEYIGYTGIDRRSNTLRGLQRGFFGSEIAEHWTGAAVKTRMLGVTVLDGGRGYIQPPVFTLVIDEAGYPAETVARITPPRLTPQVINPGVNGKILLVTVEDGGRGYPAQPRLDIESSSISATFSSSDVFVNTNTTVTAILRNTVSIELNTFRSGDPVKITAASLETLPEGLVSGETYYLGKPLLTSLLGSSGAEGLDTEDYVAFYLSKYDALADRNRIKLNTTGTGSGHTVAVTAVAVVNMTGQLVRQLRSTLKYDRVSYDSIIQQWQPGTAYAGADQSGFLDKASSSEPSSLGQTTSELVDRPGYYSNDFLASNSALLALDIRTVILSDPAVITTQQPHNLADGTVVRTQNIGGTTELNGNDYFVKVMSTVSVRLYLDYELTEPVDATGFSPFTSGGLLYIPVEETSAVSASLVLYNGTVWRCSLSNSDLFFDINKWTAVSSNDPELTALDRLAGWYRPTVNQPAKDTQLVTGIEYPNATYLGQTFTGNYRIDVNLTDASSNTYYDVSGGAFTDGYAPEELVAGVVQDSLLLNVTARPGSAWLERDILGVSVRGVAIANGGTGYTANTVIRFIPPPLANGNLTAVVSAVDGSGTITAVALGDTTDAVFPVAPQAVITSGATANVILGRQGTLDKITVTAAGINYSNASVTVSAPTRGRTAQAIVSEYVSGGIAAITVTDGGTGYTSPPTVTITDATGTGAAAASQLFLGATVPSDQVDQVNITTQGQGYLTGDLITFNTPQVTIATTAATTLTTTITVANNIGVASGMTVVAAGITSTVKVTAVPNYQTILIDQPVTLAAAASVNFVGVAAAATVVADNQGRVLSAFITNVGRGYSSVQPPVATFINSTGSNANITVSSTTNYFSYTGLALVDVPVVLEDNPQDLALPAAQRRQDTFSFAVEGVKATAVIVYLRAPIVNTFGQVSYTSTRLYEQRDYTINWVNKTVTLTASALARLELRAGQTITSQISEVGGGNQLTRTNSDDTPFLPALYNGVSVTQVSVAVPYEYLSNPYAGATIPTNTFTAPDITGAVRLFNRPWSAPLITEDGVAMLYYSLANQAGSVTAITVTNDGSGYDPVTPPQVTVAVPGQATATIQINPNNFGSGTISLTITGGVITAVSVTGTTGYVTPPRIVIEDTSGSGSGAVITVTAIRSGSFDSSLGNYVTITNGGTGYDAATTTARALLGSILSITLTRSGYGYSYLAVPNVRIIGDGSGAVAVAQVIEPGVANEGSILQVSLISIGSGYTRAQVVIDPPQFQGIPCTARANVDVTGAIDYIEVLNPGLGYYPDPLAMTVAPAIAITAPALGNDAATASFANASASFSDYQITSDSLNTRVTLVQFRSGTVDVDAHYYDLVLLGAKYTGAALSWSLPETQLFTVQNPAQLNYALTNYMGGTNPENAVVEVNGLRLIPGSFSLNYETVSNQDQHGYAAPIVISDVSTFYDSIFFNYTDPVAGSTDVIIMVGTNGSIIKTTAYPWVWTDKVTDTSLDITSIAYSGSLLLAVGDQGLILTSTDWGETWTKQTPPSTARFNSVAYDAVNSQFIIAGDAGVVLRGAGIGLWTQENVDVFGWGGPEAANVVVDLASTGGEVTGIVFTTDSQGRQFQGLGYHYPPLVTVEDVSDGYTLNGNFTLFGRGSGAVVTANIGTRQYDAKFTADLTDNLLSNVNYDANSARALTVGNAIGGFTQTQFTANVYNNQLEFAGDITGNILTVNAVTSGNVVVLANLTSTALMGSTQVIEYLTGNGGVGTYLVSNAANTAGDSVFAANITVMQVSNVTANTDYGAIKPGASLSSNTANIITAGTQVVQQNLGNISGNRGYDGQYILSTAVSSDQSNLVINASYPDAVLNGTTLLANLGNNSWIVGTAEFTGEIVADRLIVTAIASGNIVSNTIVSSANATVTANTRIIEQKTFSAANVTVTLDEASWPLGDSTGTPEVGMRVYGLGFGSGTTIVGVLSSTSITLSANRGISFRGYISVNNDTPLTGISTLTVLEVYSGIITEQMTITTASLPPAVTAPITILSLGPRTNGGVGTYLVTCPVNVGGINDRRTFTPTPFSISGIQGVPGGIGEYTLSQSSTVAANTVMYLSQPQSLSANSSITLGQRDPEYTAIIGFSIDNNGAGYSSSARLVFTPDVRDSFTKPPRTQVLVAGRSLANAAVIIDSGEDYDSNTANVITTIETSKVITVNEFTSNASGTGAVFSIAVGASNYTLAHNSPNLGGIFFGGVNFVSGEVITISGNLLGGDANNNAVLTVGNVTGNSLGTAAGSILDFTSITGTPAANVGGVRAVATANVSAGVITAVNFSNVGSGYTRIPAITVSGASNENTGVQVNTGWDADVWDRVTPALTDVEVGAGNVVAVSDNGQVFYSVAASELVWQEANTGIVDRLRRVRWDSNVGNAGDDRWIAVGDEGTVITTIGNLAVWTDVSTTVSNIAVTSINMYNDTTAAVVTLSNAAGLANGDAVYMFNIVPGTTDAYNAAGIASALTGRTFYAGNVNTGANTIDLFITGSLATGVTLETLGYTNKQQIANMQGDGTLVTMRFAVADNNIPAFVIGQRVYVSDTGVAAYNTGPYTIVDYYNNDPRQGIIATGSAETQFSVGGEAKINFTINPQAGAILNGGAITTTTANLWDIRYAQDTYAAVGTGGTIITNSGNTLPSTWTTETSNTARNLFSLVYADNTVPTVRPDWFMGGDFGSVWRTQDYNPASPDWQLLDTRSFDVTRIKVYVNGVELAYNTDWQINFFAPYYQAAWSGEYGGVYGIFSSTPWDPSRMFVILRTAPTVGSIVRITYDTASPSYVITGQNLFLRVPIQAQDTVAVTSWHDTAEQSLSTVYVSGVTVSAIENMDTFAAPVRIRTANEHNLATGQAVRLAGIDGGIVQSRANGRIFYANVLTANLLELYNDLLLTEPTLGIDTGPWLGGGVIWPLAAYNLGQTDWQLTDVQRLWVTVNGRRVASEDLVLYSSNELGIVLPIAREDDVVITSMTPAATPEQQDFTIEVAASIDSVYNQQVQSVTVNTSTAAGPVSSAGWSTAPLLEFSQPELSGGRVARAQALLGYAVTAIAVTVPGENYSDPVVTVSEPLFDTGTRAQAQAVVVNGTITSIQVTEAGSGYTGTQTITVTVTDASGQGVVVGAVTLSATGTISAVEVTDSGWGYTRPPALRAVYTGSETVPDFSVNTAVISSVLGQVYNTNARSSTWITEPITDTATVIAVKDVAKLLDFTDITATVQQESGAGRLYVNLPPRPDYQQLTSLSVSITAASGITVLLPSTDYYLDFSGVDQSGAFDTQNNPGTGDVKLILTAGAVAGDTAAVTLGLGNKAKMLNEILQFDSVDLVNNLLVGVRRGTDRTSALASVPAGTFVRGFSDWNKLSQYYYTDYWADSRGGPLQISTNPAALFLNH